MLFPLDITIFQIVFSVLSAVMLTGVSYKMFQAYQLGGYRTREVGLWFKTTRFDFGKRYFALMFLSFVCMALYALCFFVFRIPYFFGALIFFVFGIIFMVVNIKKKGQKTPLKITWRIKRLALVTFILFLGLSFALNIVSGFIPLHQRQVSFYPLIAILYFLVPFVVILAHYIVLPIEKLIQRGFIKRAKKILQKDKNLIKIGITGSFGKTTVKTILAKLLEKKYRVLKTPKSFNTPMGICLAVGKGLGDAEVFIAEMGARYTGDIAVLAKIVNHKYGILTGIGNQHLDTFGSHENLRKTKYAIIDHLPIDGFAYFNGDSEEAKNMYERTELENKTLSCSGEISKAGVYYTDVKMSAKGVEFILHKGEEKIDITTRLLGKHIPNTIALCAACALDLGLSLQDIKEAAAELQPVPHRLELIDRGDTIVIDDAYNSNVDGVRNALEVLSMFEGVKIIVTPGLVELGEEEEKCNFEVGRHIAKYADLAILNSSRGEVIKKGALEAGMQEEKIFLTENLQESLDKIANIEGEKKIILFENDLPDNFR